MQSKKNATVGAIDCKVAKKQGMIAAYLNIAAIVAALLVACLVIGLVLGLYGPKYMYMYKHKFCDNYRNGSYYNHYSYSSHDFNEICRYSC